jgi:hypothetical protein
VELEKLFRLSAKTEVAYISGVLRVAIEHELNFSRLCLDGLIFAWVAWEEIGSWSKSSLFSRAIMVFVSVAAVADLSYQMTGSESVEFSPDGLTIRTRHFGWERLRHYPLDKCSELSWRPEGNREHDLALECKVGWKKTRFGKYLSQEQAWDVLSELQRYLPDVAQKMGMSPGGDQSHITRLGLN